MSIKARPTQRLQLLALNVIVDQVLNRSEMGFETDIAKAIADLVDKTRFERWLAVTKEIRYTVFLYPSFQLLQGRRGGRRGRRRGRESGMSLVTFIAKIILWHTLTSVQQHIFEPILKRARVQHTGEMKDISTHVGQEAQTRPGIDATEKITTFFLRVSKNGQIQCLFLTVPQISPTLQGMWF